MNLVPKKFLRKFASAMLLAVALKYDCFASCLVFGLITYKVQNDAYDPIGNRLSASHNAATNLYSANSLNQYTSITNLCDLCVPCGLNNGTFAYDADGNMTADERGWRYAWNGENRLVCASNSEYVVTYAYDHRGRMVRKEISHRDMETRRIEYLWDDWNIIRETTNCQTVQPSNCQTAYVWGLDINGTLQGAGGVGGLLAVRRSDGSVTNSAFCILHSALYFPAYDANGNITEYVTTDGTVAAHYEYSAFGEPVVASGPLAATFTHQFSTKPWCAVTGFNEYVYRKYRPEIGRWMSRDRGKQKYQEFCSVLLGNNPVSHIDFIGLYDILLPYYPGGIWGPPMYEIPPPKIGGCKLDVCCKGVFTFSRAHCVIRFTDIYGNITGCRGGPTGKGNSSGSGGSSGSSGSGAGNGQQTHCKGCCGSWGNIVAGCGKGDKNSSDPLEKGIGDDLEDAVAHPERCVTIDEGEMVCSVINCLADKMRKITNACYIYRPLGPNSNTTWHSALKSCGYSYNPSRFQPGISDDFGNAKTCKKQQ